MTTCGKCKAEGLTVEHVRACYAGTGNVVVLEKPQPKNVPDSHYVLLNEFGEPVFYEVRSGKGKWAGYTFVSQLVGAPGNYRRIKLSQSVRASVMARLAEDPHAAALAYSRRHGICACCGSPLTDADSLARGFGPVCALRF